MRTRISLPGPNTPRPDRQRSFVQGVDWLNLNGAWEFRFDPEQVGLAAKWFGPSAQQWPDQFPLAEEAGAARNRERHHYFRLPKETPANLLSAPSLIIEQWPRSDC